MARGMDTAAAELDEAPHIIIEGMIAGFAHRIAPDSGMTYGETLICRQSGELVEALVFGDDYEAVARADFGSAITVEGPEIPKTLRIRVKAVAL